MTSATSADDLGRLAYQKLMLGEYKEAVNVLNSAIKKYPEDHKLYINRCYCLIQLQEFTSAMKDALNLVNYFPEIPNGFFLKADIYLKTHKYEQAEQDFLKLLEMDVEEYSIEINDKLHECQMQQILQKGYEPDIARKALRLAPSTEEALSILANGLIKNGEEQKDLRFQLTEEEEKFFDQEFEKLESGSWTTIAKPKPVTKKVTKVFSKQCLDPIVDPANPKKYDSLWVVSRDHNIELLDKSNEKELQQLFSKYGPLRNVNLHLPKKCIFVNYINYESAGKAMRDLQNYNFKGVILQMEYSFHGKC